MAGDGDAEHLPLHAAVEALDHAVRARRAGPGLAVLDAGLAAALPEALGREAAAATGREAGDAEGEGRDRLLQEGPGGGPGLLVLDRRVDPAGAPVGGDEREALAALAVGGPRLGRALHVQAREAELALPELRRGPLGCGGRRPAASRTRWTSSRPGCGRERRATKARSSSGKPVARRRGGAGAGTDREHRAVPPARGACPRPSKRQAHAPIARRAWSR